MTQTDIGFVDFLVQHRSEVQKACSDLYHLIHDRADLLSIESAEWEACGLLTGVAFSLWRAVFTVSKGAASDKKGIQATEVFLLNLIETNAVGFSQEQNSWSYGYYLNNARFRLIEAYKCLPENFRCNYEEGMKEIARMVEWMDRGQPNYPEYLSTHKMLLQFLALLTKHLNSDPFIEWPKTGRRDTLLVAS